MTDFNPFHVHMITSTDAMTAWQSHLLEIVNTGLELAGSTRLISSCRSDYHALARAILRLGIDRFRGSHPCKQFASAIQQCHARDADWSNLVNDAWMAAHHAGPQDPRQWLARAAAKSAHNAEQGWSKDLAIAAAWVARTQPDRLKVWSEIADIVEGNCAQPRNGAGRLKPSSAAK